MINFFYKFYFLIIFSYAVLTLIIVYVMEFFFNLPPCELCVYQRIPYFLPLIISFVSIFQKDKKISYYLCFFFLFSSLLLSIFHSLVERGIVDFGMSCAANEKEFSDVDELRAFLENVPITKCNEILFSISGVSLANINLIISLLMVTFNLYFVMKVYGSRN